MEECVEYHAKSEFKILIINYIFPYYFIIRCIIWGLPYPYLDCINYNIVIFFTSLGRNCDWLSSLYDVS